MAAVDWLGGQHVHAIPPDITSPLELWRFSSSSNRLGELGKDEHEVLLLSVKHSSFQSGEELEQVFQALASDEADRTAALELGVNAAPTPSRLLPLASFLEVGLLGALKPLGEVKVEMHVEVGVVKVGGSGADWHQDSLRRRGRVYRYVALCYLDPAEIPWLETTLCDGNSDDCDYSRALQDNFVPVIEHPPPKVLTVWCGRCLAVRISCWCL